MPKVLQTPSCDDYYVAKQSQHRQPKVVQIASSDNRELSTGLHHFAQAAQHRQFQVCLQVD